MSRLRCKVRARRHNVIVRHALQRNRSRGAASLGADMGAHSCLQTGRRLPSVFCKYALPWIRLMVSPRAVWKIMLVLFNQSYPMIVNTEYGMVASSSPSMNLARRVFTCRAMEKVQGDAESE